MNDDSFFFALHPSRSFVSYDDARALEKELARVTAEGLIQEITVTRPQHPLLEEHWYRHLATGDVYRYCPPEFPARGAWEKVDFP